MPSKSKSQQQAAGAALAAKRKGSSKGLKGSSKEMYNSMSKKQLKDFASTKTKGLPKKASVQKAMQLVLEKRANSGKAVTDMVKALGLDNPHAATLLTGAAAVPLFAGTLGGYGTAKALAPSSASIDNLRKEELAARLDAATRDTVRRIKAKQAR